MKHGVGAIVWAGRATHPTSLTDASISLVSSTTVAANFLSALPYPVGPAMPRPHETYECVDTALTRKACTWRVCGRHWSLPSDT
jgi:hypothetical protein